MGVPYIEFYDFREMLVCRKCLTVIANSKMVSVNDCHVPEGEGLLLQEVHNSYHGERIERDYPTGYYYLRECLCKRCNSLLGHYFEMSKNMDHAFKEGKTLLLCHTLYVCAGPNAYEKKKENPDELNEAARDPEPLDEPGAFLAELHKYQRHDNRKIYFEFSSCDLTTTRDAAGHPAARGRIFRRGFKPLHPKPHVQGFADYLDLPISMPIQELLADLRIEGLHL